MVVKNLISLLRWVCSCFVWIILSFVVLTPSASVYAQDPDEEGEIFWGDEEDEEEIGEDEFEEEEEYLDDEEYYDEEEDEEEDYADDEDESYYEDNRLIEDEDDYGQDEELAAGEVDRSGWSIDIYGSTPRLVNYTLWKEFSLADSVWSPKMDAKISIEAPYMLSLIHI